MPRRQITYNILIHACVGKTPGKGRVGTALALAEEMRAKGVPFDRCETTYPLIPLYTRCIVVPCD